MKHNACIITTKNSKSKGTIFLPLTVFVCCIAAAIIFISAPVETTDGAIKGLNLCANIIIPSLFPFCVIATFIVRSNTIDILGKLLAPVGRHLFGLNGNATGVILLSMLSGYPVGAKLIRLLYEQKQITLKQAKKLICCCVNPGPAFIVLAVGQGILKSAKIGYLLLISNIVSCILINIIFRSKESVSQIQITEKQSYSDAFVQSVSDAAASILGICGLVVLFSSFLSAAATILPQNLCSILTSLCEITTSVIHLRKNIIFVAIALGWCGISVHAQIMSVSAKIFPNYLRFAAIRLFHGLLLAGIMELLMKIFKVSLPASSIINTPVYSGTSASLPAAIALLITCLIFLYSCNKNSLGKSKIV